MTSAHPYLLSAFAVLDDADVRHCLLRGHGLFAARAEAGDVDLLVAPADLPRAERALAPLGFVPQRAWGHAPHRFLIGETDAGLPLKLDFVTALRFGRPIRHLEVDLASTCLGSRRRREGGWVPSPELEFVALLLHALLDKPDLSPSHRVRLTTLWGDVVTAGRRDVLGALVARCTHGALSTEELAQACDHQDWDLVRARRTRVARRIFWRAPARAAWWLARGWAARRAAALLRATRGGLHG